MKLKIALIFLTLLFSFCPPSPKAVVSQPAVTEVTVASEPGEITSIDVKTEDIGTITVTAYHLKTPTSSGYRPFVGCIALSRDLEKKHKIKFGDIVAIKGVGLFIFADRMPPQWSRRSDMYLPSVSACHQFGIIKAPTKLIRLPRSGPGCPVLKGRELARKLEKNSWKFWGSS